MPTSCCSMKHWRLSEFGCEAPRCSESASESDSWAAASKKLAVQRDLQFGGELLGVERAAGEVAIANLDGGNFAPAVVDTQNQAFGFGIVVDHHFREPHYAFLHKRFRAAAIGAPYCRIHHDGLVGHFARLQLDASESARVCGHTGLANCSNVDALMF